MTYIYEIFVKLVCKHFYGVITDIQRLICIEALKFWKCFQEIVTKKRLYYDKLKNYWCT